MNRVSWADYAKGIGIILVVYGHVLRGLDSAGIDMSKYFFNTSDKIVYGFHMPLFFFLSGLFAEKWIKRGFINGIVNKAKTLMYPYIVWSVIQASIMLLLSSYTTTKISWNIIYKIIYSPIEQFWFLYVLFLIFLIYYPMRKVINPQQLVIISLITYVVGQFFNVWLIDNVAVNLLYFSLGILFMEHEFKLEKIPMLVLSLISFLVLNYFYINFTFNEITLMIVQLFTSLTGIFLVISLSMLFSKTDKLIFLKYLGTFSMVIYLVHIVAGSGFRIILLKILHINSVYIHTIGGVIAGLILPIVFYKIVKILNLNGLLFGEFTNRKKLDDKRTKEYA